MKNALLLILSIFVLTSCANNVVSPFWELPDERLDEIAIIFEGRDNAFAVAYNPKTCERIGEACGFFRLQAYAHSVLNHPIYNKPRFYTESLVNEADCWAAQNGRPNEITAAVAFLSDTSLHEGIKINGDPVLRAKTIKHCAIEKNRYCPETC